MAAEGLLENPALFTKKLPNLDNMVTEYIRYAKQYNASLA